MTTISQPPVKTRLGRIFRTAIITLGGAIVLATVAGCYSPQGTDTLAGAALGAGGGALIGSAEGSPGTGAALGGLGGGLVGYIVGTEMQNREYYGPGYYSPYYYR
ncbi:MAG TPA: glycine zipper domain-containing protein [Candidatus Binataceae bacterium]